MIFDNVHSFAAFVVAMLLVGGVLIFFSCVDIAETHPIAAQTEAPCENCGHIWHRHYQLEISGYKCQECTGCIGFVPVQPEVFPHREFPLPREKDQHKEPVTLQKEPLL